MDLLYKKGVKESDYSRTDLVKAVENGHLWTKKHLQLWVKGEAPHKDKKIETILARIRNAKKKVLRVFTYPGTKKLVYALPRYAKNVDPDDKAYFYHEVQCTECLVRFRLVDPTSDVYPQKYFKSYGSVPDWTIKFGGDQNPLLVLGEFSSRYDTVRGLPVKLKKYPKSLPLIERDYDAQAIVVFVLDVERWKVKEKVERLQPVGPYYFIDYASFLDASSALDAPYIFADGSVTTL